MRFQNSYILLEQEGHLIRSSLTIGLTKLRNSHVHNKGEIYASLFNLSIGIERLLKAIFIMHHMLHNDLKPPTKGDLQAFKHDLIRLYAHSVQICSDEEGGPPDVTMIDPITQGIMSLLRDFALTARYHNLDSLSSSAQSKDPLKRFEEILQLILSTDIQQTTIKRIKNQSSHVERSIKDISLLISNGLDGSDLTLRQGIMQPLLHEKAAPFFVLRVVMFLIPLKHLITNLSYAAYSYETPPFPQMHEFLDFLWDDRQSILRKKRWP